MPHPTTRLRPPPERSRSRRLALLCLLPAFFLPLRAHSDSSAANANAPAPADIAAILRKARVAESRGDPAAALRFYERAAAAHPHDPAILQEISKQYSDLSDDVTARAEKQRLLTAALGAAQRALALQPRSAVDTLSVGICYGKLALVADTGTKVADSRLVRDYAERALALDPDYALAHFVLGRWFYEVAAAGATKRFFAGLLYGGLPPASFADAIREFRRAIALDPGSPANHAELGFALRAAGDTAAARAEFARAVALPPRDEHDVDALRRARAALTDSP